MKKGERRPFNFPDADRCTATVKRTGKRCQNRREADGLLCGIHSGRMTQQAGRAREDARLKRLATQAWVEAPREPKPPTEQELLWEQERLAKEEAAARRERDLHPPDLTEAMREHGLTWTRHYLGPNHLPGEGFHWITDESGTRHFRWVVTSVEAEKYTGIPTDGGSDEIRLQAEEWAAKRQKLKRMRELGVDPRRIANFERTGSIYGSGDPRVAPVSDDQPPTLADLTVDGVRLPEVLQ